MTMSGVDLLDLPDEILFHIFKKLDNIDVLYSLVGVNNDRLDHISRDKTFSDTLNFASILPDITIVDRFCDYILPRIHSNLKCLIVEPTSMGRILLATHYPNLTELKLFHFERNSSLRYFTGRQIFCF